MRLEDNIKIGVDLEGGGELDEIVYNGIYYWRSPTIKLASLISVLHALDAEFVVVRLF